MSPLTLHVLGGISAIWGLIVGFGHVVGEPWSQQTVRSGFLALLAAFAAACDKPILYSILLGATIGVLLAPTCDDPDHKPRR